MCTVTFVPVKEGVVLTTNRDEWHTRTTAIAPATYEQNGHTLLYPTDKDGGGSWIVTNNKGDAGVLLNGAFERHTRRANYRQSRGLILPAILNDPEPLKCLDRYSLVDIEPFTLVLYINRRLSECRWDGEKKTFTPLPENTTHIWSSVTLYDKSAAAKREQWFDHWQKTNPVRSMGEVIGFHQNAGKTDPSNALVMDRQGKICTVSITSVLVSQTSVNMIYYDIKNEREYKNELTLSGNKKHTGATTPNKVLLLLKTWWARWSHWEYWPFDLVYIPVYCYWMWLSIKARSFLGSFNS
ncbi:MAG: hypothetical protein EOO01_35615, partial [Chitinophagaceae bacterium]